MKTRMHKTELKYLIQSYWIFRVTYNEDENLSLLVFLLEVLIFREPVSQIVKTREYNDNRC